MNITKKFRIFLLSILIAGCPVVVIHAQELIAVHPLRAAPGTEELARYFYLTMLQQIPFVDDTDFRPFPIDLTRLPPDVPAGGFPPWVCPSPVITGGASYALTGESVPDADAPGNVRIRLYLWRMEGARLLGSDEMTVSGRADIEMATPFFLEWVFSWIEPTAEPETIVLTERERVYVEVEVERIVEVKRFVDVGIRQPYEPSWLYLGIRLGGGGSRWVFDEIFARGVVDTKTFISANIALYAELAITNLFSLQTEANFIMDIGRAETLPDTYPNSEGTLSTLGLQIPLLLKFTLRNERLKAGIFAGPYFYFPLGQHSCCNAGACNYVKRDFEYAAVPGILFGMNFGWRMGRGNIILDGRIEYDGLWFESDTISKIHYRTNFRFNIGYEIGFFSKRNRR